MSAEATTMAKPILPPLQTPKSASFPSEIVGTPVSAVYPPLSASLSAIIKQEQDMKTPITPPTAYTDFLKALTPVLASPPPSALARANSDDSVASSKSSGTSFSSFGKPPSPTSAPLPPPTPQSAPLLHSGQRTPTNLKRLRIPQYSPLFSPPSSVMSPRAARAGMMSAVSTYSPYSPADWAGRSNLDHLSTPRSACSKPVSVRSVVTRTVTYKRTNLEPAPKGKKRKMGSAASSICSDTDTKERMKELVKSPAKKSHLSTVEGSSNLAEVKSESSEEATLHPTVEVSEKAESSPSATVPAVSVSTSS